MIDRHLKLIAGNANPQLAQEISSELATDICDARVETFGDGEIRVRIHETVRGADVFVLQPTCPPVNDNLMELLILIDALRRASARKVVAVVPYYGYGRQDRKDIGRVPISARLGWTFMSGKSRDSSTYRWIICVLTSSSPTTCVPLWGTWTTSSLSLLTSEQRGEPGY